MRPAPHKIKSLTVYWGQDVDAKFFYRSPQKLGSAINAEVLPGSGNGVRHKIVVTASDQDPAAPLLVRLLHESRYPASLDTGPAIVPGEIGIFLGERPYPLRTGKRGLPSCLRYIPPGTWRKRNAS